MRIGDPSEGAADSEVENWEKTATEILALLPNPEPPFKPATAWSEYEKNAFRRIGFDRPDDRVPRNISDVLAAACKAVQVSSALHLPPRVAAVVVRFVRDFSEKEPELEEEDLENVTDEEMAQALEKSAGSFQHPSVESAFKDAVSSFREGRGMFGGSPDKAEPESEGRVKSMRDLIEVSSEEAEAEKPKSSDPIRTAPAAPRISHCPRCRWDLSVEDIGGEPTDEDRMRWAVSMYGGKPFCKEMPLLGGRWKVRFRELSATELSALASLASQAASQASQGPLVAALDFVGMAGKYHVDYANAVMRYRMPLQLCGIWRREGGWEEAPESSLEGWSKRFEIPTSNVDLLERVLGYVQDHLLKTESVYRIVQSLSNQFNFLTSRLEGEAYDPDFWPAVES
jgi:hypothetical protein